MKDKENIESEMIVRARMIKRANSPKDSFCVSGEDVDGVYCKYSSVYLKWHLRKLFMAVSVRMTDEKRDKWLMDNPAPVDKFSVE